MYRKSLVVLVLILVTGQLFAQKKFTTSAFFGTTATQVQGDALAGFDKLGITGGIGTVYQFNKSWGLGFELSYIQKGSRKVQNPDSADFSYYKMALHYAEVPVFLRYKYKKIWFEAGPTFGILIAASEENSDGILAYSAPFKQFELGIMGGVAYQFNQNWGVKFRTTESISSIRDTPAYDKGALGRFRGQYNTSLIFQLFYQFL